MEIMEKNPNPTKDQHFMHDQEVLKKIRKTAGIQDYESIVEIGGGEGALTDYLITETNHVTVIEKDPYYAAYLRNKYKNCNNVMVVEGDALDFDYSQYDRIVANLPYTITEPFLMNLAISGSLDYNPNEQIGSNVKSITLVLSQNSVRKMVAPVQITEGKIRHLNHEFGIMGIICKAFCDTKIVFAIPSSAFFPEPAVTSFLVNMTAKKEKTTVDRILREMLIDKKGKKPSVKKVYSTMLLNGKLYKINKHKKNNFDTVTTNFTSKSIQDTNIYDLSNPQMSQLVQDLIRNDISIKSKAIVRARLERTSEFDDEDMDEEEMQYRTHSPREKFEKKYDYMYDSKQYNVLLNRGLEYIDPEELQAMFGNEVEPTEEPAVLLLK